MKEIEGKINLQNIINAINTKAKLIFITLTTNPTGTFLLLEKCIHKNIKIHHI
ncbi:MAG: hypothetical protein ACKESC_01845 [Candidatus Hodgkinia cicadicola]